MSLYKKYDESPKGDSFRIPENPTKYSDVTFMNKVAENSGKTSSVMSGMMKTVKTYQTSTTSQVVTATNPGTAPK